MQTSYGSGYRTSSSEKAVIATARDMQLNGTRQGVIYAHGALQTGISLFQSSYISQPMALTAAGYPFIGADLGNRASGTTSNWLNSDSMTATTAAYNALVGAGAKSGKVCLFGVSMGGGTVVQWASQNPSKVTALFAIIPAINLNDIYVNNKNGYQADIGAAWSVTPPAALPTITSNSPLDYDNTHLETLTGFPIQLWCSDNDPIACATSVAETWATAINALGGKVNVSSLGAQGHDESPGQVSQLVEFFRVNGGLT